MKTAIVYHSADLDGLCSAAIAVYGCRKQEGMSWITAGYDYGERTERIMSLADTVDRMMLLDISLPMDRMLELAGKFSDPRELIWIDHHVTAIEAAAGTPVENLPGCRRVGDAACELTWEYFFSRESMPEAVRLLGRWDVWDHDDKGVCKEFQFGMRAWEIGLVPANPLWEDLFIGDPYLLETVRKNGEAALGYQDICWEKMMKKISWEGSVGEIPGRWICCNAYRTGSQAFESVYDPDRHCGMVSYWHDPKSGNWQVSLYTTREDVDCGALAKERGGGGHRRAAGFQMQALGVVDCEGAPGEGE